MNHSNIQRDALLKTTSIASKKIKVPENHHSTFQSKYKNFNVITEDKQPKQQVANQVPEKIQNKHINAIKNLSQQKLNLQSNQSKPINKAPHQASQSSKVINFSTKPPTYNNQKFMDQNRSSTPKDMNVNYNMIKLPPIFNFTPAQAKMYMNQSNEDQINYTPKNNSSSKTLFNENYSRNSSQKVSYSQLMRSANLSNKEDIVGDDTTTSVSDDSFRSQDHQLNQKKVLMEPNRKQTRKQVISKEEILDIIASLQGCQNEL